MVDAHCGLGFPRPTAIDLTELGILIRHSAGTGAFDLVLLMEKCKVDTFFSQLRMDVGTVRLHVNLRFLQTFRIKKPIEPLVGEFLLERPADSFRVS